MEISLFLFNRSVIYCESMNKRCKKIKEKECYAKGIRYQIKYIRYLVNDAR